ncbi:MAG TPA: acyl-CoA thioesterase [Treponemataceae bacterium]|nr:acyl-CoA thioesterase [Treponemataceae bacterium]
MNTYAVVRTEHLNHHGALFGGQLLLWVDEYAWMSATLDFPGKSLVTRAMDTISFRHSAPVGSILRFNIFQKYLGVTSVKYHVDVYSREPGATQEKVIFSNCVTFVSIDKNGQKTPLK